MKITAFDICLVILALAFAATSVINALRDPTLSCPKIEVPKTKVTT